MIGFLGAAIAVTVVVVAVVLTVLVAQLVMGEGRPRCSRCGSILTGEEEACAVCEAPFEQPDPAPSEDPERERVIVEDHAGSEDPDVGYLNPGITPDMVRWALAIMFLGLGVRVLGMLDPVGLEVGVPDALMAALTVVGGIAAFVGFIVLDIA